MRCCSRCGTRTWTPWGDTVGNLMTRVRGLGIDALDPDKERDWFEKAVLRRVEPLARFVQRYETVQDQIEDMIVVQESHKSRLLRDVNMLDRLYEATVDYFHQLELYILAAGARLRQLDEEVLPELQARAEETGDMLVAQNLRDMTARRDDLERRILVRSPTCRSERGTYNIHTGEALSFERASPVQSEPHPSVRRKTWENL
ncbi:MAG: toxic anion resistance protein [Anaerolineales bacterium]